MKIMIGVDVDPVLPASLRTKPVRDVWACLSLVEKLTTNLADELPPMTWFIRSDESVRFSCGSYDAGFLHSERMWKNLVSRGHDLGWHMHLMSMNNGTFRFDPNPHWLSDAHAALSVHFPVKATRIGWDYASNRLFAALEKLGILIDFSAMPGQLIRRSLGGRKFIVDWLTCPDKPYFPNRNDYRKPSIGGSCSLKLFEVPVTIFDISIAEELLRIGRRLSCFKLDPRGLCGKVRRLTDFWPAAPKTVSDIMFFYFHPEDLGKNGLSNLIRNLSILKSISGADFLTASKFVQIQLTR